MRAVLLAALVLALVGCGKDGSEKAAEDGKGEKGGAANASDRKTKGEEKPKSGAQAKQFTILVDGGVNYRRTGGAIFLNEGTIYKENWTKLTEDPTVLLLSEVSREFNANEVKANRMYKEKEVRIIGTAHRVFQHDDGEPVISIVRTGQENILLRFPVQSARKVESVKPDDLVVADGVLKSTGTYVECNLVWSQARAMEGNVYNGPRVLRTALKLP